MLLTKLTLKNYGVFRDENIFDFVSNDEKPIILCGGKNGSGKTTLFESVSLCLYGISSFEKKVTRKEYEKFLSRKIHRYLGTPVSADFASITVEFQFFHQGRVDHYSVNRMWRNEDGKILELLTVKKNGEKLDSVLEPQWQSFIEELIPLGISRFFFFDGEKITKIAEEENEDVQIRDSFNTLLGLDLVKQLQTDLKINIIRRMKGNEKEIEEKLASFEAEKKEINEKIRSLIEKKASINTEIDVTNRAITSYEGKIAKLGGNYAPKREMLKAKKEYLKVRLASVEDNIRKLCHGLLPFCAIPEQISFLEKELKEDQELLKKQFEKEILEKKFVDIQSELSSDTFWSELAINYKMRQKITHKLAEILRQKTRSQKYSNPKGVFEFSTSEMSDFQSQIEEIKSTIPSQLEKHTKEFDEIIEKLQKVETGLSNAPHDDEIGPIISDMNKHHEHLGILKTEFEQVEHSLSTENAHLKIVNSNIHKYIDEQHNNARLDVNSELSQKVQDVLEEYSQKLKTKKLEMLEQYLLEFLQTLLHKEDFITRVKIDKETFAVTLYGKNDILLPHDLLSMGEKQMLATAILWALAKTSGKPLPFMIDTPLARLDVKHRQNLVERFFPGASHQVLIFSTDAEVDEKYYDKLSPYISKSYSMAYVSSKGKAKVSDGYFWDEKGVKKVATI